ncbi:hypothetical protein HBI56_164030 [Parastagonospora nodorum]|nr:hypothetical protein HBI10_178690 [Parastagonospora nodorum]KAH4014884.1 hypothetical protein HBI13_163820 [Parastagonospora nodorum]KAH4228067.1 hypothetical protein HBI06_095110 [Parastagonospora nodorum]KAH4232841.1 hypothetical protein HBI05_164610 [Parastagonospora nodorum]KAH4977158.1 hypothetical protein HBI76_228970 [Parastagonospora nodorum]
MDAQQQQQQETPDWAFGTATPNVFDDLWHPDMSALDFQSAFDNASYATPGTADDLNTLPLFDDLPVNYMNPAEPAANTGDVNALDSFAFDQLIQSSCPTPPPQRRLPRRRSKYVLRRSTSRSRPIAIPTPTQCGSPAQPLAIERWQNSPPEEEAASLSAIYDAMVQQPFSESSRGSRNSSFDACKADAFKTYRGPSSSTSLDSGVSDNSVHSNQSGTSQSRRRRANKPRAAPKSKAKPKDTADRIFKCTFCCDTFKHKYDWARHEKSLHLNMEEWICTPHGGSVVLPLTGRVHCAYCSALDPTQNHLESHNYSACQGGHTTPRTFRRKDHLVQHLRLVHGLETLPLIDDWKVHSTPVTSRCGFCDARLDSWEERTDHLAAHFRSGKTMWDWKGEHGLDPEIDARVSNAFPPYLIAAQAVTLVPFSATNHESIDHTKQVISQMELESLISAAQEHNLEPALSPIADDQPPEFATANGNLSFQNVVETRLFADTLTRHLARFARQQMMLGVMPTDEMFQRESRRLLYQDADDAWNQTVADDPEWIRQFRERTGFS